MKVYGKFITFGADDAPIYIDGCDINNNYTTAEPIYTTVEAYAVRPQGVGDCAGIMDKLDLVLYTVNGTEYIIGCVEFRISAYLYYTFRKEDEDLIKKNIIPKEVYYYHKKQAELSKKNNMKSPKNKLIKLLKNLGIDI